MPPPLFRRSRDGERSRGQTVVEFALILPALVLLLLFAIDFGRAFLGWVSLNNAARVGANYAANYPYDWNTGTEYADLMAANVSGINCTQTNAGAAPVFGPTKTPGELVRVNLNCSFKILTPVISAVVGGNVNVSSSAAFPITSGCLAACPTGPPGPPPPPPANNCRTVPVVKDLSVAGARNLWVSAGFSASNFIPAAGPDDTRTVDASSVTEPANTEGCVAPEKFFSSTMTVSLVPLVTPKPADCEYVPNLLGVTVATARNAWTTAGFTGAFLPTGNDARIVIQQVTDPPSTPGDCLPVTTTVTVAHGPPLATPPPAPCKVPSFINTSSSAATTTWTGAGFTGGITFKPAGGGGFTIKSQSLVGGTYVHMFLRDRSEEQLAMRRRTTGQALSRWRSSPRSCF